MATPLKLAATVTLDASQVPAGAQATKQAIAGIGNEATASTTKLQKLVDAQLGLARPAANTNSRAAEIAAYGAELDRLQAKFDPLFAAQLKYQNALSQIDQAQRLGVVSASQAIDLKLKETNAYNALASAAANAAAANKRYAEAAVSKVTVTPDRGADIAAYGAELDRLRAKYNPLYAVTVNYKTAVSEIREAHKAGAISTDEMTAAITRNRQATLASIEAIKGRNSAMNGDREGQFRRQNLMYQVFDTGQSAALGMPLAMVAMQQGPQVIQMYAGQGGVNAALKDLGTIAANAGRLITPLSVSIGGLATVAAVGAAAWSGYLSSIKEVETAANGLGRAVAGSATSMEASAQAGAASAGISVKAARSMEAAFLRTGRIGNENYEGLISISKDFAATIGTDAASAGQALADLFADPAKAAQTLYQQYGLIDAATAKQATNLAAQNRQSEAQAVLLKALPPQLASAAEATTALGRAWNAVSTESSNAFDWIGKTVDKAAGIKTLAERIASLRNQLSVGGPTGRGARGADKIQAELDALLAQQASEQAAEAERQRKAAEIRKSQAALGAADAVPANADVAQRQSLTNSIAAMQSGLTIQSLSPEDRAKLTVGIEAQTRALDALNNRQSRAIELDRLDIQIQNERNPLVRADLTAQQTRLRLADQQMSADQVSAAAAQARNRVIQETIASSQTQAADMASEIAVRARLAAQVAAGTLTGAQAQTQMESEIQLRPLIAAAAKAEGKEKEQLLAVIEQLRSGYSGLAAAQREANVASYLRDQKTGNDRLGFQIGIAGKSQTEQASLLAQYDAELKIRELGLEASSAQANQIRRGASAQAQMNAELSRTSEAWSSIRKSSESAIDGIVDGLSSGDISGALEGISKDIQKTVLDLAVKNPLKNALTGSNYGTLADVGGVKGVASNLLGDSKSVGSMAVTAGTVMINGGVAAGVANSAQPLSQAAIANDNSPSSIARYAQAIKQVESGNNYTQLGPITKSGDRAYGAYQVMGANIPSWTKETLGQQLTPSQFLADPTAQDKVFAKYFGQSLSKYGNANDAASVWFSGRPMSQAGNAADVLGTTTPAYVQKFNAALGQTTQVTASANQNLGTFGNGLGQLGNGLTNLISGGGNAGAAGGGSQNIFGGLASSFSKGTTNLMSSLFGGSVDPTSIFWRPNTTFSSFLGFDSGGYTGAGGRKEPAGVVHKGEVVWSQDDVARAGGAATVDAMRLGYRGYDKGGVVGGSGGAAQSSNDNGGGNITVHNYSKANVQAEQTTDASGRRQTKFVIADMTGDAIGTKGGKASKTIEQQYGLKKKGIAR
ncbi:phage tail length tape measure family protein [Agrobacterium vitis]|uniref:phage tail length tape measure family protein n=1 Tax=Rhizobium/Agrobacterium group TaxID=227290 RepID=UPI0018D1F90D|nr:MULTISPECIES: phage tail length tape measure family protein [Rhizobium/Agrobacterium group]